MSTCDETVVFKFKTLLLFWNPKGLFFQGVQPFCCNESNTVNTVFLGSTRSGLSTAEDFVEKVCCCTEFGIE